MSVNKFIILLLLSSIIGHLYRLKALQIKIVLVLLQPLVIYYSLVVGAHLKTQILCDLN